MKSRCQFRGRVTDFAADELTAADQWQMESHLAECHECREALAGHRQFIASLRSLAEPEISSDLVPRVLAAIHERPPLRVYKNFIRFGAAAAAVLLISLLPLISRTSAPAASDSNDRLASDHLETSAGSLQRAIGWLCKNQETDGSWNAEKWGGNRNFKVALTALPAIAVMGKDASTTPERAAVAAGAIRWLLAQQTKNGTFGPDNSGLPYNHSIATLALLHAHRLGQGPNLKKPIDAAISAMVRAQSRGGGWSGWGDSASGYLVTAWHIEALRLAAGLGMENVKPSLERGLAWLAAHPLHPPSHDSGGLSLAGEVGPVTERAETDLCRAYFLTVALQREDDEVSRQRLTSIRRELVTGQAPTGIESGSWPPDDQWGRSGGRIFSTALISLSLGNG